MSRNYFSECSKRFQISRCKIVTLISCCSLAVGVDSPLPLLEPSPSQLSKPVSFRFVDNFLQHLVKTNGQAKSSEINVIHFIIKIKRLTVEVLVVSKPILYYQQNPPLPSLQWAINGHRTSVKYCRAHSSSPIIDTNH